VSYRSESNEGVSSARLLAGCALTAVLIGVASPWFAPAETRAIRAGTGSSGAFAADESARQVTVFAILATPASTTVDPRLEKIQSQLRKVLPDHGFKLLDVQSKRIEPKQTVTCRLGNGYKAETTLVRSLDENGKVQLRCTLEAKGKAEFSTLVKTAVNQLFLYERSLDDGTRVMIGVGAR
jgi:hypothetical protein